MTRASIPVDLTNPGQVFACLGLVEAARVLMRDARGAFDWNDPKDVRFHIETPGPQHPVGRGAEVPERSQGRHARATRFRQHNDEMEGADHNPTERQQPVPVPPTPEAPPPCPPN